MKAKFTLLAAVALLLGASRADATLIISPAAGYSITWNGNEGDFFTVADPASTVPPNLARFDSGAVAFADHNRGLGNEFSLAIHFVPDLNDGRYGNKDSWISDTAPPNFAGIRLAEVSALTSIAWGRDNGNSADCCGGQLTDRSLGVYTLQFTTAPGPDETTPDALWTTIGSLNYLSNDDSVIGGGFTSYFRHQYEISLLAGGPIVATGVRIIVPGGGITAAGTDIDEIELFGGAVREVPGPSPMFLLGLGLTGMALARGRRGCASAPEGR